MKPEVHERFSGQSFGLRDFVLVMRKDEVFAASVQIESVSQFLHRHGRALNVPAGTSRPDRTLPERLPRLGSLPKGEVASVVFFVFIHVNPRAIFHSGKVFFRKLAVGGKTCDAKVIRAIVGAVGETLLYQVRQ